MRSLILVTAFSGFSFGFQASSPSRGLVLSRSGYASRVALKGRSTTLLHLDLLAEIDYFFTNSPYTTAALVCGVKASAADGVAQFQEWENSLSTENKVNDDKEGNQYVLQKADFKRNVAFIIYGSLYQGLTQEFLFNHLYPIWFGAGNEWAVVLTKVAFTLLVQTPFLTLPSLYLIKAAIEEKPSGEALGKYIDDIKNNQLLLKFYLLWTPVLTLTFRVIPEQWRVAFMAFVSFFWLIILSGISSESTPAEKDLFCTIGQDSCEFEED